MKLRDVANVETVYERDYLFSFMLAAVFAAALIIVAVIWASADSINTVNSTDQNLALLRTFGEVKKETDVSVIMLGNSRMRHAVNFGYNPEEVTKLPDGRTMASLQFSNNASEYRSYDYMESDFLFLHPDVIIILDALLSIQRFPYPMATAYGRMVVDLFNNRINGLATREKTWEERQDLMPSCFGSYNANSMNERIKTTAFRDAHSLDPKVNERNIVGVRRLIDLAVKAGIKVVIVSLPPNHEILRRYNVPDHILDFYGLGYQPTHEQLLPELHDKVTWLTYPAPDDTAYYCDFVHLNSKGREQSQAWFLKEISDLTKK